MTGVLTAQSDLAGQPVEGASDLTTVQTVASPRRKKVGERATKSPVALPHVLGEDLLGGGMDRDPARLSELTVHDHHHPLL
jgi:hypothetical protein